jgi:hypothetical protein
MTDEAPGTRKGGVWILPPSRYEDSARMSQELGVRPLDVIPEMKAYMPLAIWRKK